MTEELLPCPFCGGDVEKIDSAVRWIHCPTCEFGVGSKRNTWPKTDQVKWWNTRAQPQVTDAKRQAALDALKELAHVEMRLSLADWGRICSTIRTALSSPAVPVIDGLDEAIKDARSDTARYENGDACVCIEFYSTGHPGANAIIKAAQAYSSLSKDEKVDLGAINYSIRCLRWIKENARGLWTMNCDEALLALEKVEHFGFVPEVKL